MHLPQSWLPAQSSLPLTGLQAWIGGYIGATYYLNNAIALLIGCNLGYDMLGVDLDTGDVGFSGDFYVSPSLSIGIRY